MSAPLAITNMPDAVRQTSSVTMPAAILTIVQRLAAPSMGAGSSRGAGASTRTVASWFIRRSRAWFKFCLLSGR